MIESVSIISALLGGLVSFFTPCVAVLVPAFLAHLSGISLAESKNSRGVVFLNTLFFVFGFTLVFVLLGASLGFLSEIVKDFDIWLARIGGVLIIFFGLAYVGLINISWFSAEHKIKIKERSRNNQWRWLSSFGVGVVFAIGWTPCVSPILAAILIMAGNTNSLWQGAGLLLIYSLGLMLPFMIVGLSLQAFAKKIGKHTKVLKTINIISGVILIIFGIILITGNLSLLLTYLFNI